MDKEAELSLLVGRRNLTPDSIWNNEQSLLAGIAARSEQAERFGRAI
jgi:hypothetical protein